MNYVKRVVIDTGTLISAAIRVHSVPSLAYQKALRDYEICISEQVNTPSLKTGQSTV